MFAAVALVPITIITITNIILFIYSSPSADYVFPTLGKIFFIFQNLTQKTVLNP